MNEVNEEQAKQIEALKKRLLSALLTKEAYERLARVRLVNPELASQLDMYLIQLHQAGKIQEAITDPQLKDILQSITNKKDFNIKFR